MIARSPVDHWIRLRTAGQSLAAWQLGHLRATLSLAREHSPFYARHLAGVPLPETLADISALPFTSQADIRREGHQFLCVSQSDTARVVTLDTSGTTGLPKRIWFTQEDQESTVDYFHHGMTTLTGPGDKVLILLPCAREGSVGDLLFTGVLRLGALPIKHGLVKSLPETLKVMAENRADALVGVPAQINALALYAQAAGLHIKLKSVLLSTDHAPLTVRRNIEKTFDCEVFDHYGMTETGLGGGVECGAHAGYHLRAVDLYYEVVDPHTLCPVSDGEEGEVVFTTLTRKGMPLVRYRTGDISRFLPGPCPCGSDAKRLERVTRRLGAGVGFGEAGTLELCDLDEALFALPGLIDFTAGVEGGPDGARVLTVIAAVLNIARPACGREDVERALLGIEVIKRAVAAGALTLYAQTRAVGDWPGLHAGKRTLDTEGVQAK